MVYCISTINTILWFPSSGLDARYDTLLPPKHLIILWTTLLLVLNDWVDRETVADIHCVIIPCNNKHSAHTSFFFFFLYNLSCLHNEQVEVLYGCARKGLLHTQLDYRIFLVHFLLANQLLWLWCCVTVNYPSRREVNTTL